MGVFVVSCAVVVLFFFKGLIDSSFDLKISAGSLKGKRSEIAHVLAGFCESEKIKLTLVGTEGSQESMKMVSEGRLDIALVQGGLSPMPNVRQIAVLSHEALHLVVRNDLSSKGIPALKGKKINLSKLGSGTRDLSLKILEFAGIEKGDFIETNQSYGFIDSMSKVKNSSDLPDAFFTVSLIPSIQVQELVKDHDYRLIELPFAKAFSFKNFAVEEVIIPEYTYSVYPEVPDTDIKTIGTQLLLIAYEKVPEQAIKRLLYVVFETRFAREVNFNHLNEENLFGMLEFPLHAGAAIFKNRNQPAITCNLIEGLENFRSFVFSFFIAAFLAWRWYLSQRSLSLDIYMKKISRIENKASELALEEYEKEAYVDLLEQIQVVKNDGLKKVLDFNIKNEGMLNAFVCHVQDARTNIIQQMNIREWAMASKTNDSFQSLI